MHCRRLLPLVGVLLLAAARPQETPPPNLFLSASRDLAAAAVGRQVQQIDPIQDQSGRTRIFGTAATTGTVSVEFIPDDQRAVVDLVLTGTIQIEATAVSGPVRLFTTGLCPYVSRKRVVVDAGGIQSAAAETSAELDTRLVGVCTTLRGPLDGLLRRLAVRRFCRDKPRTDFEGAQQSARRVSEAFEKDSAPTLEKARGNLDQLRGPFESRGLQPEFRLRTTARELSLTGRLAEPNQTWPAPPPVVGPVDLSLRLHESFFNRSAVILLAGRSFTQKELDQELSALLGPMARQLKRPPPGAPPFKVAFARERPVAIRFADGGFHIHVGLAGLTEDQRAFEAMNLEATYRLAKTADGLLAIRQGEIDILPPGFVIGKDTLSARQLVVRNLLRTRFERLLPPRLDMEALLLTPELRASIGPLEATQAETKDGWLALGWRRLQRPGDG